MFRFSFIIVSIVSFSFPRASSEVLRAFKNTISLSDLTSIGGAKLLEPSSNVTIQDFSMCVRFYLKRLGKVSEGNGRVVSIMDWRNEPGDSREQLIWFSASFPNTFMGIGDPKNVTTYGAYLLRNPQTGKLDIFQPNKWHHVCLSYRRRDSFVSMIQDGVYLNLNHSDPKLKNFLLYKDFLNKVYLGRCPFTYRPGCTTPGGIISDFNIWSKPLSSEQMQDWTMCRKRYTGDIVNWDESQWELENMTELMVKLEDLCRPSRPGPILMNFSRPFNFAKSFCHKLKAKLALVNNSKFQEDLVAIALKTSNPEVDSFWGGWTDEKYEGRFQNVHTQEFLQPEDFQPWFYGEPNGGDVENCQTVWPLRNAWNDFSCSNKAWFFCDFDDPPYFNIRGFCPGAQFDDRYTWTDQMLNGAHKLDGFTNSRLFWSEKLGKWALEVLSDPSIYAFVNSTNFPLGLASWEVYNYDCDTGEEFSNPHIVPLHLSTCTEDEFNCNDGSCVSITDRCDGRIQCPDKSDELECELVKADATYLKDVPAPPISDDNKTIILLGVDIMSVLEISEVDSILSLQFVLFLEWRDPRLTFENLKSETHLNTLSKESSLRIWIPEVEFFNTRNKLSSLNDEKSFTTITRNGSFELNSLYELKNIHLYEGEDNPLKISRVYSIDFICDFQMNWYPFDTQECNAIFVLTGNSDNFATLMGTGLSYRGPPDLTQYFVKSFLMTDHVKFADVAGIEVQVVLGRRLLSIVLTTFLPTILICAVSFSTNFFQHSFFEAAVTVNLTSLLVLTTLFVSISDGLPKTAYIKMIDIWLIVCLLIPFCEVILHTLIDNLIQLLQDSEKGITHEKLMEKEISSHPKPKGSEVAPQKGCEMAPQEGWVVDPKPERVRIRNERCLKLYVFLANKGLPIIFFFFTVTYFALGLFRD